ncbi:MAG: hypothetical protein IT372_21825 [Polyangiaceae bacterium]|nr:hypothetical protein [Polyangiaceae bacterium]
MTSLYPAPSSRRGAWTLFEPEHWKSESWEIFIFNPAPGVLYTRMIGYADLACARHAMRGFDRIAMAPGLVDAFHDWEQVTGYRTEVRQEYTAWSKGHSDRLSSIHVLLKSRIVAMGVSVFNAACGGIVTAHHSRASFERIRAQVILRRRQESGLP